MEMNLDLLRKELKENTACLLYFYNDSCAPCKAIRPKVSDLIQDNFPKIRMILVNAAAQPEITAEYGVFSAPVILVFIEGKEVIRESKYFSIDELAVKIDRYYSMVFDE